MTDIEKVIKGLEKLRTDLGYGLPDRSNVVMEYLNSLTDAIELLKDQEIGHWIFLTDCSNSGVYCSECNTKVFDSYPFKKKIAYFCPHCGTRMEGEIERR